MKEDAKEAREKAKTEQENAIQKPKEEREEMEKRIAESRNGDTVSISESGFVFQGYNLIPELTNKENIVFPLTLDDAQLDTTVYRDSTCLDHKAFDCFSR